MVCNSPVGDAGGGPVAFLFGLFREHVLANPRSQYIRCAESAESSARQRQDPSQHRKSKGFTPHRGRNLGSISNSDRTDSSSCSGVVGTHTHAPIFYSGWRIMSALLAIVVLLDYFEEFLLDGSLRYYNCRCSEACRHGRL